jgi:DNA helicase HerA-like ATPase
MELGKGEALVSFLEGNGTPAMVERVMVRPPTGRIGPITPEERKAIMAKSPVKGKYDTTIDSESAYEVLQKRVAGTAASPGTAAGGASADASAAEGGVLGQLTNIVGMIFGTNRPRGQRLSTGQVIARDLTRSVTNKVVGGVAASLGKSVGGSLGSSIGRSIVRGTLGGVLRR